MSWILFGQILVLSLVGMMLVNAGVNNIVANYFKEKTKYLHASFDRAKESPQTINVNQISAEGTR